MPEPGLLARSADGADAAGAGTRDRARRVLHVLNGDAAAEGLRAAGIPGAVTLSADLLYEGPAAAATSPERWRRQRARFLAECGYDGYDEGLAKLTSWDRALEDFHNHDEVVLWFEHDLFDQLQLCRVLAWFASRETGLTDLSLVQAGDYLGLMPPQQLSGLLEARRPVTDPQKRLALAAWSAFCGPEPTRIEALLRSEALRGSNSPLPWLAAALRRHLEEFPGLADGLSRSERQALAAAAAEPLPFSAVLAATQRMEERVFMTDLSLLRRLQDLAAGARPLLRLDAPSAAFVRPARASASRNPMVTVTHTGLRVLAEQEDWIALRGGIDLWLGGVHLQGREPAWRWDRESRRLFHLGGRPLSAPAATA
jgi:Domain of unknown function (DUF1835)